jgi:hypothetical protein
MRIHSTEALVLRDEAGTTYILTADMLDQARAAAERAAGDDTAGFTIVLEEFQRRPPVQVVGLVAMPLPARPFEPNQPLALRP